MKDIREKNLLKIVVLALSLAAASCHQGKIEIVSWSAEAREIILKSSLDIDLPNLVVRQGETQKILLLTSLSLTAGVPKTFIAPKNFLNKQRNSLTLFRLIPIDSKEDF